MRASEAIIRSARAPQPRPPADLGDRLDHAGLVVREHQRDQGGPRILLQQEPEVIEILRRALSVRQTEKRAASFGAEGKVVRERRSDPFTRDAEEKLSRRLKSRVRIVRRRRGGKIEIAFGSEDELIGLFERLSGKN